MNRNLILSGVSIMALLVAISCNRKDDEPMGGKGGAAVLKLNPAHHGKSIDSSVVYIKYNASDIPTSYDDSMRTVQEGGKAIATFSGLKKGKYYLFARGYDPTIPPDAGQWFNSKGGMSFEISREDSTYNLTLPVTEVH